MVYAQSGHVQIFDLASSVLLENVEAHTDSVTSISMASDKVNYYLLFVRVKSVCQSGAVMGWE